MARKREENVDTFESTKQEIELDDEAINSNDRVAIPSQPVFKKEETTVVRLSESQDELVNCLTNEKVIVRFIAKPRGMINDPKHILYGQMAPKSKMRLSVPILRSGVFADVLTKSEKKYLEYVLGLEPNALSVYRKNDNFWDDSNPKGIGRVELIKGDNYFDKSKPIDYIKLAILKSQKDIVAPSMQALQDNPKATYRFVIINEDDTVKQSNVRVTLKAQAYKEFGKIEDDKYKMRVVIELIDGRPTAANTKLEFLQGRIGDLIESNTKMFLSVVKDPLLDNKVLIRKAIEAGIIASRGNYLYYKETNTPLCGEGQEPTLNVAAKFLSLPKNQELKFLIEAKVKE